MSEVALLGGTSLTDYFLGGSQPTPSLANTANFADAWMSQPNWADITTPAAPVVQTSWWNSFTAPWSSFGRGLATGAGNVVSGINQKLPEILTNSLLDRIGWTSRTVPDASGKNITFVQPSAPGVPPVVLGGTTGGGTPIISTGGLATGTILIIVAALIAVVLLTRK